MHRGLFLSTGQTEDGTKKTLNLEIDCCLKNETKK